MTLPGFTAQNALYRTTRTYRAQPSARATPATGLVPAETTGFHYDCSGKVDGNYPHPTKCTHYVACVAQTHAYEMPCAMGHDGKLLHYVQDSGPDPAKSYCDYPEVAGCERPGPDPS